MRVVLEALVLEPRGRLALVRRWVQNPVAWLACTVLLTADAVWISGPHCESVCGAFIWRIIPCAYTEFVTVVLRPEAWVCRTETGYDFVRAEDWVKRATNLPVAGVYHNTEREFSGFWALTRERATEKLEIRGCGLNPSSAEEGARILREYLSQQPSLMPLANGPRRTSRVLWAGVAHNAGTVVVGAIWLASWPGLLAWMRPRRRRLAAGLCPECAYDMRSGGLAACPECGWSSEGSAA